MIIGLILPSSAGRASPTACQRRRRNRYRLGRSEDAGGSVEARVMASGSRRRLDRTFDGNVGVELVDDGVEQVAEVEGSDQLIVARERAGRSTRRATL